MKITVVRIQNRGSRFVLVSNEDYKENIEYEDFETKVKLWIYKW